MWKCLLVSLLHSALSYDPSLQVIDKIPIVAAPAGQFRGSTLISRLGKPIYSFRGVRYAEPPVGELRFKPPVPYKQRGIFDATRDGARCPQPWGNETSEDCLFLNVYTTELPTAEYNPKRPVVVFLHPGGYYSDSGISSRRGPEYLLDQEIVLVTFNYRLASLGFISTGDAEAPGNNGLKDQVLALKWVQQNIASFGGDQNSVTLLGYSAGSSSTILHTVSPMSRGLFHKAMSMSGSPFSLLPIKNNQVDIAKKQAALLGCPSDTSRNIITCLKTKSEKEITDTFYNFRELGVDPIKIWTPVIEEDFGQERFLPEHPIKLVEEGKFTNRVPFITGVNKDEFAYTAFAQVANETVREKFNTNFEKYAPISFVYERNTEKSKNVSREIKKYFLNDQPVGNETLDGLINIYCDSIIGYPVHRTVKLMAKNMHEPVYYYQTTYLGRYTNFFVPGSDSKVPYGVVHHDELIYIFYNRESFPLFDKTYPEARTVKRLTTMIANFARTGNPTPNASELFDNVKWETFDLESEKYLAIGNTFDMRQKMFEERYSFWEKLFPVSDY